MFRSWCSVSLCRSVYCVCVCKCVLCCCHRVSTELHLTNISYHLVFICRTSAEVKNIISYIIYRIISSDVTFWRHAKGNFVCMRSGGAQTVQNYKGFVTILCIRRVTWGQLKTKDLQTIRCHPAQFSHHGDLALFSWVPKTWNCLKIYMLSSRAVYCHRLVSACPHTVCRYWADAATSARTA